MSFVILYILEYGANIFAADREKQDIPILCK